MYELKQIKLYDSLIQAKLEQIGVLRDLSVKTTNLKAEKVQTEVKEYVSKLTTKIIALETAINKDVDRLVDVKDKVIKAIDSLDDTQQKIILFSHYINGETMETVAQKLHRDLSQTYKIKKKAVEELQKAMKCH